MIGKNRFSSQILRYLIFKRFFSRGGRTLGWIELVEMRRVLCIQRSENSEKIARSISTTAEILRV